MQMNTRLIYLLIASCALSFGVALWAYTAGAGFIVAFLLYSFGGSALMVLFTALSFVPVSGRPEPDTRLIEWRAAIAEGQAYAQVIKAELAA